LSAKLLLTVAVVVGATALQSCHRRSAEEAPKAAAVGPEVIGLQWTKQAAERTAKSGKPYALPQLRVYDAHGQLVYNLPLGAPPTIGSSIDNALKLDRAVPGPTLAQSLADLQTYQGAPASSAIAAPGSPIILDYWATWCIPCKKLEKSLLAWAAQRLPGSVRIVKAETDVMKAMRAAGQRTFMVKKDACGKPHMIEVK
jgi:thiol-disulfide isomerase/thioredoxin